MSAWLCLAMCVLAGPAILAIADGLQEAPMPLMLDAPTNDWRVVVSPHWDVLGPFPIHAREQHFLSPSYPLDLSKPIKLTDKWPSSYADNGTVGWSTSKSEEDGNLRVSFPDIRWDSLRATEGWAALQYHSILRTSVTIYPPSTGGMLPGPPVTVPPYLLVDLLQGSFFTILPATKDGNASVTFKAPEWYAGNIYAMGNAPPQAVPLPKAPSIISPTMYDLFVSGDYEIRLFGDPHASDSKIPTLLISLSVDIQRPLDEVVVEASHIVTCDFVAGWAFGDAVGVGIRSIYGWWTVTLATSAHPSIALTLLNQTRIAPTQTRIVPLRITQTEPFNESELSIKLLLQSEHGTKFLTVPIPITQHTLWTSSEFTPIKTSYFFALSMPTAFLVLPPKSPNVGMPHHPILALHGAGVDIFAQPFWSQALPRQEKGWVVMPSGRTAWGLDWHGPSAQDAWDTVTALSIILRQRPEWNPWIIEDGPNLRVLIIGHSNGGQGTWYMASRFPDRVVAAIPAAGYIKSQAYVPLTQSRSAHFVDPALRAILESSLTPDDNDLFLSNLADTPILAIHGGDDDNVATWHTREAVSILKTWRVDANITYLEDHGEPHWYPTVFNNTHVRSFMDNVLVHNSRNLRPRTFTLTVSIPADSGTLHGWRIESVIIPGRLARITVKETDHTIFAETTNVRVFSVQSRGNDVKFDSLILDEQRVPSVSTERDSFRYILNGGVWELTISGTEFTHVQPTGRMSNILNTKEPITLIIPDNTPARIFHAALRIAHDLNLYHKLDAQIIDDAEAVRRLKGGTLSEGNIVVLGNLQGQFSQNILRQKKTAFEMQGQILYLRGRPIVQESTGALFLHPHPIMPSSLMLFIFGTDDGGLERSVRLFPIRTGVTLPDWLVIGQTADSTGAGGVSAVGLWNEWNWNEIMSVISKSRL